MSPDIDDLPTYANSRAVAELLGVTEGLLAKWRHQRVGPPFTKLTDGHGGAVRYHREDLRAFLAERRRKTERVSA